MKSKTRDELKNFIQEKIEYFKEPLVRCPHCKKNVEVCVYGIDKQGDLAYLINNFLGFKPDSRAQNEILNTIKAYRSNFDKEKDAHDLAIQIYSMWWK